MVMKLSEQFSPREASAPSGSLTYSIDQAAEVIGLSIGSVCDLVASGELRSIRVGQRRVIPRESVDNFVKAEAKRKPSAPKPTPRPATPDEIRAGANAYRMRHGLAPRN
jgi:excisionase family DNA binding protein